MNATIPNFRLEAALDYASRGWLVIPLHWPKLNATGAAKCSCGEADCRNIGKHPLTRTGLKEGSADPEKVRGWWAKWPAANVGIVTGRQSGIVVLDVDVKDDGPASLVALEKHYEKLPPTVEAITGSGGAHRIFNHPVHSDVRNSAKSLGLGLDIRGDGGYIVAPPSLHASGERYCWEQFSSPDEAELFGMPDWLLKLVIHKPSEPAKGQTATVGEKARRWLGQALAAATPGNRSEKGHWLAVQLRDNRVPRDESEALMRDYSARVPAGDHPYTEREALATYASVMKTAAREPAMKPGGVASKSPQRAAATEPAKSPSPGAAQELEDFMAGVIDGRIYNVPFPWDALTQCTQALIPGSFCVLGGDPGVGKTFFILQCLQYWHANGFNPAVFFAEKDRVFYMRRLLAGNGKLVNFDWVKANPDTVQRETASHHEHLDALGSHIWSKPRGKLNLDLMLDWIRGRAEEGHRVIVVDPITAIDPGAERWTKESDFVQATQEMMVDYGVSIMLTTHPKQASGRAGGTTSGHDAAGGAAYFRFTDTMIWLNLTKDAMRYQVEHPIAGTCFVKTKNIVRLIKTRDSYGANWRLAYTFGPNLTFVENGVIMKDAPEKKGGAETKDPFGPPMAIAMNHLDLDEGEAA